ncbi:MAG: SGNH/GDSL hydrolase family protein [Bdellovibrionales bacterium]|nr:SGNH/GDSL hydrolase family protein [Bdellovibrionales bacterium]
MKIVSNLLVFLVALTLSLGMAELVLRHSVPFQSGTSFIYRIPDRDLGWKLQRDTKYLNELQEKTVRVSYNSQGWRDAEHEKKKPADTYRVLILGDSFMESYSVEFEESFASLIGSSLQPLSEKKIEVINFGVGGFSTYQEYLSLLHEGKEYEPDLILLAFFIGNDLQNNSYKLEKKMFKKTFKVISRPFLEKSDSGWRHRPVDYEKAKSLYLEQKENFLKKYSKPSLLDRFALWKITSCFFSPGPTCPGMTSLSDILIEVQKPKKLGVAVHKCTTDPDYMQAWEVTQEIFRRIKTEADTLHAPLVVFSVPSYYEVDDSLLEEAEAHYKETTPLCIRTSPAYETLENTLHGLGIEYVNLLPGFRQKSGGNGELLFWRSDLHWNPEGHKLAADSLSAFIASRRLLPSHKTT